MIKILDYSEGMMEEVLQKMRDTWHRPTYELVKDIRAAHLKGFSPKETRIRMEPFVPFLQECPTKARFYWNEDRSCWTFWRDTNA